MRGAKIDFSHKINHLSFGNLEDLDVIHENFESQPTIIWALDGREVDESKYVPAQPAMSLLGPDSLMTNYFLEISQVDYVD